MGGSKQGKYSDAVTKLDKIRGEVVDLKAAETGGLRAPEPGEPKIDNPNSSANDKVKDSLADRMKKDMAKTMINSIFSGLGGAMSNSNSQDSKDEQDELKQKSKKIFESTVEDFKFYPNEPVDKTYNIPCSDLSDLCNQVNLSGNIMAAKYSNGDTLIVGQRDNKVVAYACVVGCWELDLPNK